MTSIQTSYHWRCLCKNRDNKFLIVQRSGSDRNFPGLWDLPGGRLIGRLEDFDPIVELRRSGVTATDLRHRSIVTIPDRYHNHNRLTVCALVQYSIGIPIDADPDGTREFAAVRWLDFQHILDLVHIVPATDAIIKNLLHQIFISDAA